MHGHQKHFSKCLLHNQQESFRFVEILADNFNEELIFFRNISDLAR